MCALSSSRKSLHGLQAIDVLEAQQIEGRKQKGTVVRRCLMIQRAETAARNTAVSYVEVSARIHGLDAAPT
jgi:ribosomal protein L20